MWDSQKNTYGNRKPQSTNSYKKRRTLGLIPCFCLPETCVTVCVHSAMLCGFVCDWVRRSRFSGIAFSGPKCCAVRARMPCQRCTIKRRVCGESGAGPTASIHVISFAYRANAVIAHTALSFPTTSKNTLDLLLPLPGFTTAPPCPQELKTLSNTTRAPTSLKGMLIEAGQTQLRL